MHLFGILFILIYFEYFWQEKEIFTKNCISAGKGNKKQLVLCLNGILRPFYTYVY